MTDRNASRTKAQEMRNNPTPAEAHLWKALRKRQLGGLLFLRQKRLGPYIADFFCAHLKLIIEVDGSIHDLPEQQQKDLIRDTWCAQHGLHVLRFSNQQVLHHLPRVLHTILLLSGQQSLQDSFPPPKPPGSLPSQQPNPKS